MSIQPSAFRPYVQQLGFQDPSEAIRKLQQEMRAAGINPGSTSGVVNEQMLASLCNQPKWTPGVQNAADNARAAGFDLPARPLTRTERADIVNSGYDGVKAPETYSATPRLRPTSPETRELSTEMKDLKAELDARRAQINAGARVRLGADGQLDVRGSDGADRIQLTREGNKIRAVVTDLETGKILASQEFDAAKVKGVKVDAGEGNDVVENGNKKHKGVQGAEIRAGAGADAIYNNANDVKILGDRTKNAWEAGDAVLNEGHRADIKGSGGADLIVNKGNNSAISSGGAGDVVVTTGRDNKIDVDRQGVVISNGHNDIKGDPRNVISNRDLASVLTYQATANADYTRQFLDHEQEKPRTARPQAPLPEVDYRKQYVPEEDHTPVGPMPKKRPEIELLPHTPRPRTGSDVHLA